MDGQPQLPPQTQGNGPPPSIVIQIVNAPPSIVQDYNARLSKKFGILQLVLGGFAAILNGIGIGLHSTQNPYFSYYYVGTGIWCFLFSFSLSGPFALCAANKKTPCWIITNLVFSIIASVFAFALVAMAACCVSEDSYAISRGYFQYGSYQYYDYGSISSPGFDDYDSVGSPEETKLAKGSILVSTLFLATSLAEFVICVWTSRLCCKVLCCRKAPRSNNPGQPAGMSTTPGTTVFFTDINGQLVRAAQPVEIPQAAVQLQQIVGQVLDQAGAPPPYCAKY